jgi:hypothetical protein
VPFTREQPPELLAQLGLVVDDEDVQRPVGHVHRS